MTKIMGDLNPAEELLKGLNKTAEPKAESEPKKKTKAQTEAKATKAKAEGKKKERKKYYRVNLALTEDLGEAIKAEAEKQNRSVNNYIETILQEHLRKEKR